MAEQVLSQDEAAALLNGIANDQAPRAGWRAAPPDAPIAALARAFAHPGEPELYDFTASAAGARGRLPGLEVIFDDFARRLQNLFATDLGKSVDASFHGMDVVSYEQLIQRLPLAASIHAVRLEPLRGIGVMAIEARLAFALVELIFGGAGHKARPVEDRDFTPIESRFLGKFVTRMLIGMEESWHSTTPVKGRYLRSEMNPHLLNAAGMGDAMVMASYSVNIDPIGGTIFFALPLAATDELRGKLEIATPLDEDRDSGGIFQRLHDPLMAIELDVQAVVDVVSMSVGEIMRMRAGDVIQLNSAGLHEVRLAIEGLPKFIGKAAERGGNKVFVTAHRID